jgi:hypothetical protein
MYFISHQNISLASARGLALSVLLLNCQPVFAQSNSDAEPERNPALLYQSVFGAYQSYQAQPVSSWREINDEVEKIGGWRAYARETSESETAKPELQDKPGALPTQKGGSNLPGGSHE